MINSIYLKQSVSPDAEKVVRHEPLHAVLNENKSIINNFWTNFDNIFTRTEPVHAPAAVTAATAQGPALHAGKWAVAALTAAGA